MTVHSACFLVVAGLAASSCASAQAKSAPEMPPLEMPAPPPRTVQPVEVDTPAVASPDEPSRHAPPRPTPSPRREPPRQEPPKPEPPRTEPPPPEPTKPVEEPQKLQTAPAQAELQADQQIRGVLARAKSDLGRINTRTLTADARQQFNTAQRFVTQAEDALRKKNLVFARSVADKAAALAAQLAGK